MDNIIVSKVKEDLYEALYFAFVTRNGVIANYVNNVDVDRIIKDIDELITIRINEAINKHILLDG